MTGFCPACSANPGIGMCRSRMRDPDALPGANRKIIQSQRGNGPQPQGCDADRAEWEKHLLLPASPSEGPQHPKWYSLGCRTALPERSSVRCRHADLVFASRKRRKQGVFLKKD